MQGLTYIFTSAFLRMRRYSLFNNLIIIFIVVSLLFQNTAISQTKVHIKGDGALVLQRNLPKFLLESYSRSDAEWLIEINNVSEKITMNIKDRFKLGFFGSIILIPVYPMIIHNSAPVYILGLMAGGVGIAFLGESLFPGSMSGGKIYKNEYGKNIRSKYTISNRSIDNVIEGEIKYRTSLDNSIDREKISMIIDESIVKRMKEMMGEEKYPELIFSKPAYSVTESDRISLAIEGRDDVRLDKIQIFVNNVEKQIYHLNKNKQKIYMGHLDIPLNIGSNDIVVKLTDWIGNETDLGFSVFKKLGTKLVTKDSRNLDYIYPPILDINIIKFADESFDGFLDAGEGGTLELSINNSGKGDATTLEVIIEGLEESGISIMETMIPDLISAGQSASAKVIFGAGSRIITGSNPITIYVSDQKTSSSAKPINYSLATRGMWSDVDVEQPKGQQDNANGIAIIIGNKDYTDPGIYPVKFALRDAESIKSYVKNSLRYREENIIHVSNASLSDFRSIFGTEQDHEGRLHDLIFPDESDVFIFYSGHGAPGLDDKQGYILPSNVRADDAQINGYPLSLLSINLSKLSARTITLVVDACFSGLGEQGQIISNASPLGISVRDPILTISKGNSFFASKGDQISSWLPEQKHGLFTYYFLRGVRGDADSNSDEIITAGELKTYLDENVPYRVRRLTGRKQDPVINLGNGNQIIVQY